MSKAMGQPLPCLEQSLLTLNMKWWSTDVWQHKLSVTSWTYGAFLSVSFHRCHPSRCQSPACCREWLMGLADPIFCVALMSLVPRLLELILTWAYEIIMLFVLYWNYCTVPLSFIKPSFPDSKNIFLKNKSNKCYMYSNCNTYVSK